jgi:coenzyme F420-reducing hydrogenase alpha subunit
MDDRQRTFTVPVLARVEGEGALHLTVRDGLVTDAILRIYEPPRFFEGFLRGRDYTEPPDITSRICGICPIAYQMSAVHAIEAACGVTNLPPAVRELRRLVYCGEWIESHLLHIALLHAPDFLGYESGLAMAADHRATVETALRLKKLGNDIVAAVGGRAIHPVNVRVGGFHRAPRRDELAPLIPELEWSLDALEGVVRWVGSFDFPALEEEHDYLSLWHPDEYPLNEGRVRSTAGLDVDVAELEDHIREVQVEHSHALHGHLVDGRPYAVGPLARYNVCFHQLTPRVRALAVELGVVPPVRNPFRSIVVRALESLYAAEEALRIIGSYRTPDRSHVDVPARAGIGHAVTEAPRGMLYHRYEIADDGSVLSARIVPPTAQVQPVIEDDLRRFAADHLDLDDGELQWRCEQVIRNYDPCISCATHFLRLDIERS